MNTESNVQSDVLAAVKALENPSDSGNAPVSVETAPIASAPIKNDVADAIAAVSGQTRGPDGKFQASSAAPPGDAVATVTPPADGDKAPPAPKTGDEAGDQSAIKLDPSKPPQGWRPEAREKWASIPEDIRQEIIRREESSAQGVQKLRQQYEPAVKLHDHVSKFAPYFQHIDRNPIEYLGEVIGMEQSLTLGNPAQKMETILNIADRYGVPFRQALDAAMGGRLGQFMQEAHSQHQTPTPLPPEVQRELNEARAFREKLVHDAVNSEYETFVGDTTSHPFFEDVREDMAKLMEAGAAETYKEAYELAVWKNPAIRQRELARQNGVSQAEALRARQQAAGAVVPPAGVPIVSGAPQNGDESTEEAVRRAILAHQQRT